MSQEERTIIIKGGKVVNADGCSVKDVVIKGEKIKKTGKAENNDSAFVIDARGLLVLPGAVDTHVHFNDEFMGTVSVHDYYTGTYAAAFGGVTSIIDFSNQQPGQSLSTTLRVKKNEAEGMAVIDWGVHPVITQTDEKTLDEIPELINQGAPTFKCYMTYRDEGLLIGPEDLQKIASKIHESGGMLMLHAEDNDILEKEIAATINSGLYRSEYHARSRPVISELEAIKQAIKISEDQGCRIFIVHLSVAEGAEIIRQAREKGMDIMAETCTHYLVFSDKMLERNDGIKWICSPPLRSESNRQRLWEALRKGSVVMVTSDDAAYSWEAKLLGKNRFDKCPNGIPGIEPRLNLLYSEGVVKKRITLTRFVELISTNPAKYFGLGHRKGSILPGMDADIVLLDPEKKWLMNRESLHMNTDWSAYENIEVNGKITKVMSRGDIIVNDDELIAEKGRGQYLFRKLQ